MTHVNAVTIRPRRPEDYKSTTRAQREDNERCEANTHRCLWKCNRFFLVGIPNSASEMLDLRAVTT